MIESLKCWRLRRLKQLFELEESWVKNSGQKDLRIWETQHLILGADDKVIGRRDMDHFIGRSLNTHWHSPVESSRAVSCVEWKG